MQNYQTNFIPNLPGIPGSSETSPEQAQKDDEERRKKLAAIAGMITGMPIGEAASTTEPYSISQAQQASAIESQLPADVNQPVNPTAEEQFAQQPAVTQQPPVTQPAVPTNFNEQAPNIGQLPQMGPATQVAGTNVNPVQPASLSTEAAKQVAQTNPQVTAGAIPGQGTDLNDVYHESVIAARNEQDPQKRRQAYAALLSNENVPEGYKTMANRFISEDYLKQREQQKAEDKIASATPNDLARYMQGKSEEGSYVKAILFARLGLTELAKEEQQKLGAGSKTGSATDATTGQRYTVERNANGEITRAFNQEGKRVGQEEIARLSAATLPTQAHQLPSVHGSPVINSQGQTGLLMYDPQTQSSYVQVGNQRLPTSGWTTMAQNVQNVYGAAQAGALGKNAGEGLTPQPMRPLPGSTQAPAGGAENPALTRAQGDVAGLDRQITELSRLPATDKTKQQRIAILQQEKVAAQQRVQQASGAVQGLPAGAGTQAIPGAGATVEKANIGLAKTQAEEGLKVAAQRSQAFNKILDEEVRPEAKQGDAIVNARKQQFAIFDRPGVDASKIFGIANGAGQSPGDQRWTMLRDILAGKTTATDDQIRERTAALGLNREEQSALAEYAIANAKINAATLKQTAGAGSVSDAEQRANREMNVDPTKIPGLGAYNAMAQSQFSGDLARYKADWASTHPATNALQLDKAWRKESQTLTELYTNIAKERAKFITQNGATTPAVKEAYKRFPVPEYDPQTETWKKTKPLSAYER